MKILALDTSSQAASCALVCDGALVCENFANNGLTHSQTLMPMIEQLLGRAGIRICDIDVFAVSTGPGSFTGLRIGISSVKGMAMAANKPCAAVPTLFGLACNAQLFDGYVAAVMDARRSQFYTALFECRGLSVSRKSPDEAISAEDLRERLCAVAPAPVLLIGDGALIASQEFSGIPHISAAPERFLHQRAGSVGFAALEMANRGELLSAEEIAPGYLRLPQAERERLERQLTVDNE